MKTFFFFYIKCSSFLITSDYDFQARSHNYVTSIQFCSHFPAESTQLKEKELKPIPSCESSHKLFAGLQSITYGNSLRRREYFFLLCFITDGNVEANYSAQNRKQRELDNLIRPNSPTLHSVCLNDFDIQLLKQSLFTIKQYYFNNGLDSIKQDCTVQKIQEITVSRGIFHGRVFDSYHFIVVASSFPCQ